MACGRKALNVYASVAIALAVITAIFACTQSQVKAGFRVNMFDPTTFKLDSNAFHFKVKFFNLKQKYSFNVDATKRLTTELLDEVNKHNVVFTAEINNYIRPKYVKWARDRLRDMPPGLWNTPASSAVCSSVVTHIADTGTLVPPRDVGDLISDVEEATDNAEDYVGYANIPGAILVVITVFLAGLATLFVCRMFNARLDNKRWVKIVNNVLFSIVISFLIVWIVSYIVGIQIAKANRGEWKSKLSKSVNDIKKDVYKHIDDIWIEQSQGILNNMGTNRAGLEDQELCKQTLEVKKFIEENQYLSFQDLFINYGPSFWLMITSLALLVAFFILQFVRKPQPLPQQNGPQNYIYRV